MSAGRPFGRPPEGESYINREGFTVDKMNKEALAVKKAEQAFDRKRRTIGLYGGPLLAVLTFVTPFSGLTVEAHKLLAIMVLVAIWWITEPVPIPVTSLIGPTLAVVTGVVKVSVAFAAFANPMIFLFMGGFIIAKASTNASPTGCSHANGSAQVRSASSSQSALRRRSAPAGSATRPRQP